MQSILELSQISKSYNGTKALERLDLTIPQGETTVLIGPSGCGKSTILRLMIGLVAPDSGTIMFNGSSIAVGTVEVRRRMGYVIQEGGLFPHLSAENNITLMARYLRWDGDRIAQRVQELSVLAHLAPKNLTRFPAQLSGGERQRVSLMRALMLDPEVLLLDEPLGALDPMIRAELQTDLKQIFQALNKTVVLVTHDLGEAVFFGERIVLLREGRIVQTGTIDQLVNDPAELFVTRFISAQRSVFGRQGALP